MLAINTVYNHDLLTLCSLLDEGSVNLIVADLPFGLTENSWDVVIPFAPMWKAFKRVAAPNAAIVLNSKQPFTSMLVTSNLKMFRQELIWKKSLPTGHLNARVRHLEIHENILVFSQRGAAYYPQLKQRKSHGSTDYRPSANYGEFGSKAERTIAETEGYPTSVIEINTAYHEREAGLHPTQKPEALLDYIIRTYSKPGDVVIDPCCGSGTTAQAARALSRNWIISDNGFDDKTGNSWADISRNRLSNPYALPLFVTA